MTAMRKPRLAIWKLSSCDGCQLSLLDCEEEFLAVAESVELASFPEASTRVGRGPYDLSLVEGSISTARDLARIQEIRRASKRLVTIGACATAGGVQALRNLRDFEALRALVYASPEHIDALASSTPVAAHVRVDGELRGCPVNKHELLEVIAAALAGRTPALRADPVCVECKARGTVCVMVAHGTPCLGPVTHAGCGALCPAYQRGCYGCFGPSAPAQSAALVPALRALGLSGEALRRAFSFVHPVAPSSPDEAERHD